MRWAYKKISNTLNPSPQLGIDHINIPDSAILLPQHGNLQDPKMWMGPWRTIRDPEKIAQAICTMNILQYNQAYDTPFGSGPLAQAIGRKGDTMAATQLLNGELSTPPVNCLLPETIRLLTTLTCPYPLLKTNAPTDITEAKFISTYKIVKEDTSSSPS
jgi:hypothetical protein